MEELSTLLKFLINKHEEINHLWEIINDTNPYKGNQNVSHVLENANIIKYIHQYREFIALNETFQEEIKNLDLKIGTVTRRVKDHNSIQYKLERYMGEKHRNGEVPIKKCLNDILGFRIIFHDNYNYEEIKNFILNNFNNVKVIDSSKGNYKALHAYFIKDNKKFMWELQMWNKEDEENNLLSHHKHKQDYIVWEDEEKEAD